MAEIEWGSIYLSLGFAVFCFVVARTLKSEQERILGVPRKHLALGTEPQVVYAAMEITIKQETWWSIVASFLACFGGLPSAVAHHSPLVRA